MRVTQLNAETGAAVRPVDPWLERIHCGFDKLEATIEASEIETRRHIDVVAGRLRSDLARIVSDVATTNERLYRSLAGAERDRAVLPSTLDDQELLSRILERSRR